VWTDLDRCKHEAFIVRESDRCPRCHMFSDEFPTDMEIDTGQKDAPYDMEMHRCWSCFPLDQAREEAEHREKEHPTSRGLRGVVFRWKTKDKTTPTIEPLAVEREPMPESLKRRIVDKLKSLL